jgi:hypothetical protein
MKPGAAGELKQSSALFAVKKDLVDLGLMEMQVSMVNTQTLLDADLSALTEHRL